MVEEEEEFYAKYFICNIELLRTLMFILLLTLYGYKCNFAQDTFPNLDAKIFNLFLFSHLVMFLNQGFAMLHWLV